MKLMTSKGGNVYNSPINAYCWRKLPFVPTIINFSNVNDYKYAL